MRTYEFLARRNWPRTYTGKILFVSFIGVHVPMFGAVIYALLGDSTPFMQQLDVLAAMLVATLLGTAGTMFVMHQLLAPVHAATNAANGYLRDRTTPRLPTRYPDGAGVLMASVQECITRLDTALTTTELHCQEIEQDRAAKFRMLSGMKHDFRTPLTHILGLAELMKAESIGPLGGESYKRFVSTIANSGQDLLQTLESVLDLSDAEAREQLAEDSETFDAVAVAEEVIGLEHLFAEKRGVAVDLAAPDAALIRSVPKVAKNLMSALLQAGVSGTARDGRVALRIDSTSAVPVIAAESHGGTLWLEDVPADLVGQLEHVESGTGAQSDAPETSTPMTLRIALIKTLAKAVGATLSLHQSAPGRFEIRVAMTPPAEAMQIAAE